MLKSKTAFNKLQIKNPAYAGFIIVKELYLKRIFKISAGDNRILFNGVINIACKIISDKCITS